MIRINVLKYKGSALLPALVIIMALGILIATIIAITRNSAKTTLALTKADTLRQAAYAGINFAELKLSKNKDRSWLKYLSCPFRNCSANEINWININYSNRFINRLQYGLYFKDYVPYDLNLFSSNGSYVYALFSKAEAQNGASEIIFYENFWLSMRAKKPKWMLKRIFKKAKLPELPNINPTRTDVAFLNSYLNVNTQIEKRDLYNLSKKGQLEYWYDNKLIKNKDATTMCGDGECALNSGWIYQNNNWYWVLVLSSNKRIIIWKLAPDNIEYLGSAIVDKTFNDNLISNMNIAIINGKSYAVGILHDSINSTLKFYSLTSGKMVYSKNLGNIGDHAWLTITDFDSNLTASNMFIYGSKGTLLHLGIANSTSININSVDKLWQNKKLTTLITPPIIYRLNSNGDVVTILAEKSRITAIKMRLNKYDISQKIWQRIFSSPIETIMGDLGVIWILLSNGKLSAVTINTGKYLHHLQISSDSIFQVVSDLIAKKEFIEDKSKYYSIENMPRSFMREGFRQTH